jgi:hypothetical protein
MSGSRPLAVVGGGRATGGIMPRKNLWNANVPRVELNQRVRDTRLRLERIERLLVPRATATNSWLRRVFYLYSLGIAYFATSQFIDITV